MDFAAALQLTYILYSFKPGMYVFCKQTFLGKKSLQPKDFYERRLWSQSLLNTPGKTPTPFVCLFCHLLDSLRRRALLAFKSVLSMRFHLVQCSNGVESARCKKFLYAWRCGESAGFELKYLNASWCAISVGLITWDSAYEWMLQHITCIWLWFICSTQRRLDSLTILSALHNFILCVLIHFCKIQNFILTFISHQK